MTEIKTKVDLRINLTCHMINNKQHSDRHYHHQGKTAEKMLHLVMLQGQAVY